MAKNIIQAEKIEKSYKLLAEEIKAVNKIDLEVSEGEFVAIMGPSGSGKTTLLDALGCLDKIDNGNLKILGRDVSKLKEKRLVKIRRENMGFVFQDFLLIRSLTVLENVELPLMFARKKVNRKQSLSILEKVGLLHRKNHLPNQISGGEKQRTAIARALITKPKLLIADEPTGNLDSKTSEDIFMLLKKLNKEDNLTIIIATHDQNLGNQANRIINIKDGKIENEN